MTDTLEQEEGVWVEKREEQADEWEEEAGLREQEANIVHMENNEWEEDEEEVMEEERYITVLHNRLRREELRLRNSNIIHSILWFVKPLIDKSQ